MMCCIEVDGTPQFDDAKQRGCGLREARGDAAHKSDTQKQNPTRRWGFAGSETRRFGTRRTVNCKWLRGLTASQSCPTFRSDTFYRSKRIIVLICNDLRDTSWILCFLSSRASHLREAHRLGLSGSAVSAQLLAQARFVVADVADARVYGVRRHLPGVVGAEQVNRWAFSLVSREPSVIL
jgi:hypothetical protein